MYFAPFELRKVWCYSDVNWTPLSLSYSSGIPYPVNSLLAQTLNREFHKSLWSFTGANKITNDCTYSLEKPASHLCSHLFSLY